MGTSLTWRAYPAETLHRQIGQKARHHEVVVVDVPPAGGKACAKRDDVGAPGGVIPLKPMCGRHLGGGFDRRVARRTPRSWCRLSIGFA